MINAYSVSGGAFRRLDCSVDSAGLADATWVDLLEPIDDQAAAVAAGLGVPIPARDAVRSIDTSGQIYREGRALVMTVRVVSRNEASGLRLVTVTFVLAGGRLVTLRHGDPTPFRTFVAHAEREPAAATSGETVMAGLLEAIVARPAELLAGVGDELEAISTDIFGTGGPEPDGQRDLRPVMQRVGRSGDMAKRVRGSLHTLARIVPYLKADRPRGDADGIAVRLDTLEHDIAALLDHDSHLMSTVTFPLDATLGLISIQQNAIIKIFSVAAVIFLPPTLIASICGMNFVHIPELHWTFGHPYALGLMVLSAVLPFLYFKYRQWL